MIGLSLLVVAIALFVYAYQKWQRQRFEYFVKRGIKFNRPRIISDSLDVLLQRISMTDALIQKYTEFPDEPVTGLYQFTTPQFTLRDPDTIKKVVVKDFDHFEDHTQFIDVSIEPLFGNSLISLTGEKWRHMRATLSPAFTGSKMRQMFGLVTEYADEAAVLLLQRSKAEKLNFEMKDFFSRYTNDIIATCAFGLKVNSIAEPENDFFAKSQKLTANRSWSTAMKFILIIAAPKLVKLLKIPLFDKEYMKEFRSMIMDTMNMRKEQNIHRPDMIHLLMQVRDGSLAHPVTEETESKGFATVEESDIGKSVTERQWSDDELVAQCLLFFFAGLETVSTALTFGAYEMVANPDVQQKLYEEISESNEQLNGKRVSYDELQKLTYLDQFISEVLRKWPPAVQSDRVCVKEYQFDYNGKKFTIEKGRTVLIPTYGLHHDERYFPEPEKFDPERFSDENKSSILPGTYLPFGLGPRNCIGSRFALMELKGILYYLILNFSLERNEKTVIPIVIEPIPRFGIKNGLHLELRPRQS